MRYGSILPIAAATLFLSAPAAATTTVNLGGGSSSTSGTAGNVRTFTAAGGLQVQASAWSWDGSNISRAYLGWYGNGLGVTNATEGSGGSNSHAIDNYLRQDFVLLVFNQSVNVASGVLNPYAQTTTPRDNDAAISYTNVAGLFAAGSGSIATNSPLFGALGGNMWNVSGNPNSPFATGFNSGSAGGNVWLVGGAFDGDGTSDGFKLASVNVTAAVPEPGTWAMFLIGFGAIGGSMRRVRARKTGALQAA